MRYKCGIIPKEKSLAYRNPNLAKQWHPTKNGKLTPWDIAPYSNQKRWWQCPKHHKWQASPNDRSKYGCPYCSGRKASIDNCLATKNPSLVKQWHPTKNGKVTPYDVTCGSSNKVWWICPVCKKVFKAKVYDRVSKAKGCNSEICRKKRILKNNYDTILSYSHPDIAKEWDYKRNYPLTPDVVYETSKNRVWWICSKCEYKWQGVIQVRCEGQRKCPRCNSLAILFPDLLREWDWNENKGIDPYTISPYTHDKFAWICNENKNHKWSTAPNSRCSLRHRGNKLQKRTGCPYCSNKKVCIDNCLATKNPELAKEWNHKKNKNLTPFSVVPYSDKEAWWNCSICDNVYKAKIRNRSKGNGCPCCSRILLKDGTVCDSIIEAFFYCAYKKQKLKFIHHGKYGGRMGGSIYDFYFPKTNTYVEVTSYNTACSLYKNYFRKIKRKEYFVKNTLKANFKFIKVNPSTKDYQAIKNYISYDKFKNNKILRKLNE